MQAMGFQARLRDMLPAEMENMEGDRQKEKEEAVMVETRKEEAVMVEKGKRGGCNGGDK